MSKYKVVLQIYEDGEPDMYGVLVDDLPTRKLTELIYYAIWNELRYETEETEDSDE